LDVQSGSSDTLEILVFWIIAVARCFFFAKSRSLRLFVKFSPLCICSFIRDARLSVRRGWIYWEADPIWHDLFCCGFFSRRLLIVVLLCLNIKEMTLDIRFHPGCFRSRLAALLLPTNVWHIYSAALSTWASQESDLPTWFFLFMSWNEI
jgi:hypothetical protein